jgi:hypothetical protein
LQLSAYWDLGDTTKEKEITKKQKKSSRKRMELRNKLSISSSNLQFDKISVSSNEYSALFNFMDKSWIYGDCFMLVVELKDLRLSASDDFRCELNKSVFS